MFYYVDKLSRKHRLCSQAGSNPYLKKGEGVRSAGFKSGFLQLHNLPLNINTLVLFFMFFNFSYNFSYVICHISFSQ